MDPDENRRWLENDLRMTRFYGSLESILKRHNPVEFILAMSARLRECRDDIQKSRQTPPFHIVHAIEACCAYSRGHQDPVTLNRIFRTMNIYHGHTDPMQDDLLRKKSIHFFLIMHRQQMELQYSPSRDDLGRVLTIYARPDSLTRSSKAFEEKYRLTPRQWILLCFLAATAAERSPVGLFFPESILEYIRQSNLFDEIPDLAVRSFLAHSSRTPPQIGERFRERFRNGPKKLPPYLHSSIRSVLLETPLINIGLYANDGEAFVLPIRDLMFRHCGEGLYRLMKGLDNFDQEIGKALESYVRQVLDSCEGLVSIHGEKQLKMLASGRCCDFLLELPGEIVLVETKAVTYTKTVLTESSILEETSTRRVADGVQQLYATAYDLYSNRFDSLNIDKTKPLLGIVVTLGDIPLVNLDWYFETFIMALATPKLEPPVYPSPNLVRRPISMTVRTLEQLIMISNSLHKFPMDLHAEWSAKPELLVGDWDAFLSLIVKDNHRAIKSLPFMRPQVKSLLVSLGVPPDSAEESIGPDGG